MTYTLEGEGTYWQRAWRFRHFCLNLAASDLRARFRRTYLGVGWAVLQPLLITAILVLVFVHVTPTPWRELSVYIYTGMILWDLFSNSILIAANSFEGGGTYLRSSRIPAIIFPVRSVLHAVTINLFGLIGLALWTVAVLPTSMSVHWVFFPIYYALVLFLTVPVAILSSVLALKFRDFQNALVLLLQALWFLSPVFMARVIFDQPGLRTFAALNPINSLCDLFRSFFMLGSWPALYDILQPSAWAVVFWLMAWQMLQRTEPSLVFDL
jgi:homopolymeric O-antigen transport system permease protein